MICIFDKKKEKHLIENINSGDCFLLGTESIQQSDILVIAEQNIIIIHHHLTIKNKCLQDLYSLRHIILWGKHNNLLSFCNCFHFHHICLSAY